jgi:hypothetical protein
MRIENNLVRWELKSVPRGGVSLKNLVGVKEKKAIPTEKAGLRKTAVCRNWGRAKGLNIERGGVNASKIER